MVREEGMWKRRREEIKGWVERYVGRGMREEWEGVAENRAYTTEARDRGW